MSEEPSLPVEIYAKQGDHPDIRWLANEVLRLRAQNKALAEEDRWTRMGRIACRTCKREKGSDYTIGCPSCFDDEHKGFDE